MKKILPLTIILLTFCCSNAFCATAEERAALIKALQGSQAKEEVAPSPAEKQEETKPETVKEKPVPTEVPVKVVEESTPPIPTVTTTPTVKEKVVVAQPEQKKPTPEVVTTVEYSTPVSNKIPIEDVSGVRDTTPPNVVYYWSAYDLFRVINEFKRFKYYPNRPRHHEHRKYYRDGFNFRGHRRHNDVGITLLYSKSF